MSAAALQPVARQSASLDRQIQSLLKPREAIVARVDVNGYFAGWLEGMPFLRQGLEFFRGRYELVATEKRLFVLRVGRLTRRVKRCSAVSLDAVNQVTKL